jgi:hypothetical protein
VPIKINIKKYIIVKIKELNVDNVYAKIIALSMIYEKKESCRQPFLERISYSDSEMKIVMDSVYDADFRNWIASSAIPVMQCRDIVSISK